MTHTLLEQWSSSALSRRPMRRSPRGTERDPRNLRPGISEESRSMSRDST